MRVLQGSIRLCTANADESRAFYEDLSLVDGELSKWRRIVLANKEQKWVFSQPNTFEIGSTTVRLKEYPATSRGVAGSWAERDILKDHIH